jgi:hypothetical protein
MRAAEDKDLKKERKYFAGEIKRVKETWRKDVGKLM